MRGIENKYIVFGESKTLKEWVQDERSIVKNVATLRHRFWRNDMSPERCLTAPFVKKAFNPQEYVGKCIASVLINTVCRNGKKYLANCRCQKCDKSFKADLHAILRGDQQTCGCLRSELNKNSRQWKGHGDISSTRFSKIKRNAEVRGIQFDVTIQEIWSLFLKQERRCALTNVRLKFSSSSRCRDGSASLDRINPSKGYVSTNVQWIHKDLNFMKSDFSQNEFVSWCERVARHCRRTRF